MSTPYTYQVDLQWKEGRIGQLSSPELDTEIEVATPPEFEKGVAGIWSPEHLFTASIVSCFMTTFLAVAEYSKLEFVSFDCQAKGVLDKAEGKMQMTEVILAPVLELKNENDREKANKIMQKAEAACLISNSAKTIVRLELPALV